MVCNAAVGDEQVFFFPGRHVDVRGWEVRWVCLVDPWTMDTSTAITSFGQAKSRGTGSGTGVEAGMHPIPPYVRGRL